ncbi:BglG family transcription antiterminator [Alkalihalobacillus macyae]|uniref:BglG family transcription antiterminator n=1 Tax=Guptibacillus hwajinpoensis TaxID=208199 RepID=UPI00273C106E|nr:BglG family transcription antiterminator [Alkalihalobacillus macyae]MDP4553219.1 BglG family transcription antiterminator [Alkalihalobacillus macyae]
MFISARERRILQLLLGSSEFFTVKGIAEELEVSERTVHRDLAGVEDILAEYELKLIKKAGVGVQIDGEESKRSELITTIFDLQITEYTQQERETLILCKLLESADPIKLVGLSNDLRVTVATVSNDLNKVEEWLHNMQLSLIRRRGYGVQVDGTEALKRHAMSTLLATEFNDSDFFTLIKQSIQKKSQGTLLESASERLLGLVDRNKLLKVEKIVDEVNGELPYMIADSAYIGLIVHLTLAVERIQKGEKIEIDDDHLSTLKGTKEFHFGRLIATKLESSFRIIIPEAEIGYITMHIRGAKLRNTSDYFLEETNYPIVVKARELIRYVDDRMHAGLESNESLLEGLVTHLGPATHRVRQNMNIHNPLLYKIKEDYADLFDLLDEAIKEIFPNVPIPEEEVGFLVLHFGSALEGRYEKRDVSILAVCSSGIGTSKMLASRLQQELPEINLIKSASLFDLEDEDKENYDLIVSTIPLPNYEGQYIRVDPFLTKKEALRIRGAIQTNSLTKKRKVLVEKQKETSSYSTKDQAISWFTKAESYSKAASSILKGFRVVETSNSNVETLLEQECKRLEREGILSHSSHIVTALLEREERSAIGIPGTSLALFHTRASGITTPMFTIVRLIEPIKRKAMDDSFIEMDTILLQLAAEDSSSEDIEIMSFISSLIIESKQSIALFSESNQETIEVYLANKMKNHIEKQLHIKGDD